MTFWIFYDWSGQRRVKSLSAACLHAWILKNNHLAGSWPVIKRNQKVTFFGIPCISYMIYDNTKICVKCFVLLYLLLKAAQNKSCCVQCPSVEKNLPWCHQSMGNNWSLLVFFPQMELNGSYLAFCSWGACACETNGGINWEEVFCNPAPLSLSTSAFCHYPTLKNYTLLHSCFTSQMVFFPFFYAFHSRTSLYHHSQNHT